MEESISGLPAVYDSDAMINNPENVPIDKVELETTANIHLDLSQDKYVEDFASDVDNVCPESEQVMKENIPNYIELRSSSGFDTSTPKAMLRKPVSKELSFIQKNKKTAFTPLETRKRIIIHTEKKIDLLNKKQGRELDLARYAKEEHELNMKHKQELHELELSFRKKMHELVLEKCKYEAEKAKLELNNVFK
ncbi:uncharacterized protein LOC123666205 [Melitaea cinxia]|uniref:uncharacterized protein LOC123666205 n=1 Tax=Melitaea cinxia TaxID=113334 RepID=UPI001E26FF2F|nr:uncharacterized protein LOC123666205 [Melitaea cinxia]